MTDPSTRGPGRRRPAAAASAQLQPTDPQRRWLLRGVDQPGGKLPLFDPQGREIPKATIRACLDAGWAAPWFANPTKPDWLVCRLTADGYRAVGREPPPGT